MAFDPFKRSIASYTAEPENNYLLLRFLAALLVIYGHSYAVTKLPRQMDLVQRLLHFTYAGGVGVDIFFAISGFLVTASYLSRRNWADYMKSRCLRIFPGLLVNLAVTVFLLGPLVSTLVPMDYLFGPQLYSGLFHGVLQHDLHLRLPGVFEQLPQAGAVNGSLWTLPAEFLLYVILSVLGATGLLFQREQIWHRNTWGDALYVVLSGEVHFFQERVHYLRLFILFGAGSVMRVYQERIPLSTPILLALSALTALVYRTPALEYVFTAWLVYAAFWFAYVPNLRFFNRAGDYSYGLYIYAFPIEQTLRQSFPEILPLQVFAAASLLTLGCAMLSWHFVENPALSLKKVKFRELLHRHAAVT